MNYIEVAFTFEPTLPEYREIIAALLSDAGFESFSDSKLGINGYAPESQFDEDTMKEILVPLYNTLPNLNYTVSKIESKNWNEQWESNFEPIRIADRCMIRAPFHSKENHYEFDIIIEPKMSFGTGHHATTELMIRMILDFDFHKKRVLDMGCGTGVLGILASMKGAESVMGIDIDTWAIENSIENVQRNGINSFEVKLGDANLLANISFDFILANINRNILLNDMVAYVNAMKNGSQLLMSGFYIQDLPLIKEKAFSLGLTFESTLQKEEWVVAKFTKN